MFVEGTLPSMACLTDGSRTLEARVSPVCESRHTPLVCLAIVLLLIAAFGTSVFGGPAIGDHEAIVALCSRDMIRSGDWVLPRFLDTAFVRKTPLPYWLVAGASLVMPPDPETGLPVSPGSARLPSALAAMATSLILWRLASGMFGRRSGRIAALLSASSLFMLLYAANATAEMLLVLGCTWSFAHFWWACEAPTRARRYLHLTLFYLALGFAMLAKGPAPIALVVIPLAVWWFLHRPLRLLASRTPGCVARALSRGLKEAPLQAWRLVTRVQVLPGLMLFGLTFVPWMIAVARRDPSAWNLWDWQYVQRAEGDFQDTRDRGPLYYVPIAVGGIAPWLVFLPEALAAPWLKRFARWRRPLFYAGVWAVAGIAVMSAMQFKKPYYILPALPGLILLISAVINHQMSASSGRSPVARIAAIVVVAAAVAFAIGGNHLIQREFDQSSPGLVAIGTGYLLILALSVGLRAWRRPWAGLVTAVMGTILAFQATWHGFTPLLNRASQMDMVRRLAAVLDQMRIPRDEPVYWADQRPDARLSFYYDRAARYLLPPADIVSRMVDRTGMAAQITQMALQRARELLGQQQPRFMIVSREHYMIWGEQIGPIARAVEVTDPSKPPSKHDWYVLSNR